MFKRLLYFQIFNLMSPIVFAEEVETAVDKQGPLLTEPVGIQNICKPLQVSPWLLF